MSTTLDELGTYITTTLGITTFVSKGFMPTSPDECIAIHEYGGLEPDMVFGESAIAIEHPRVQIAVRGLANKYAAPRAIAETIYRAMAAASAQSISSTRYLAMTPIQPPFKIDFDANSRWTIGFNVQIDKGLSA